MTTHEAMHRHSAPTSVNAGALVSLSSAEEPNDGGGTMETTKSRRPHSIRNPIHHDDGTENLSSRNKKVEHRPSKSAAPQKNDFLSSIGDKRNVSRRLDKGNTMHTTTLIASTIASSSARRWLVSFARKDPRGQIREFFENLSKVDHEAMRGNESPPSAFTVWRPTNAMAIQRMMTGQATGKGLEIKGKSAKSGKLSGYVPYLQIHEERHKVKCKTLSRSGRTRIFFASKVTRDHVLGCLEPLQANICNDVHNAKRVVRQTVLAGFSSWNEGREELSTQSKITCSDVSSSPAISSHFGDAPCPAVSADSFSEIPKIGGETASKMRNTTTQRGASRFRQLGVSALRQERSMALKRLLLDMDNTCIQSVDEYASQNCYGIELPDRLLWQVFVVDRDISRPPDNVDLYTGRPSEPAFQDMNFIAIQKANKNGSNEAEGKAVEPRIVLWQTCGGKDLPDLNPMDPRGLIMAYEENGRVLPVVSDFDCFTIGTRGVVYTTPLPDEQVELLKWCISRIESVLDRISGDESCATSSWTSLWLDVLKESAKQGFHPDVPPLGFGDAKS